MLSSVLDLFCSVSEQELKSVILKFKPTACSDGPIPASLLLDCLEDLLPTLSQIINNCLHAVWLLPVSIQTCCHSTKTALLKGANGILRALYGGDVSVLIVLDLSSAFDNVDHHTDLNFSMVFRALFCGGLSLISLEGLRL